MLIDVKLFASLREYLPADSQEYTAKVPSEAGARIQDLATRLKLPDDLPVIFLLNGQHADADDEVQEGDVVSIFPPISGG
ncbi:MAG: MoaD/ThiS family protein [Candidatus Tectomicrobia bacterium]|nr:MoaD/ThiS family protein [Candidatus Tectomicrobia bacterium]